MNTQLDVGGIDVRWICDFNFAEGNGIARGAVVLLVRGRQLSIRILIVEDVIFE